MLILGLYGNRVKISSYKKPLICQAGSAEAFAGSSATGTERIYYRQERGKSQVLIQIGFKKQRSACPDKIKRYCL
jgi:hypothetical protein